MKQHSTEKNYIKLFSKNFIKCGLIGWCMEIIFTSMDAFRRRDMRLKGTTSIWMFPIYGSAALLYPITHLLKKKPIWFRGLTYMLLIFSAEYVTGSLLTKRSLCPWDYYRSKWNYNRHIRLDYAPFWFAAGLLFEWVLQDSNQSTQK